MTIKEERALKHLLVTMGAALYEVLREVPGGVGQRVDQLADALSAVDPTWF